MPTLSTLEELSLRQARTTRLGSPVTRSVLPLAQLTHLRVLHITSPHYSALSSVEQLTQLRQLTLKDTMPVGGLPCSLTALTLEVSNPLETPGHLNAVTTLHSFQGRLLSLDLGTWIQQWAYNPGALAGLFTQHLTFLSLWFTTSWPLPPCSFTFSQLQKLELVLGDNRMAPYWDFSGCPRLQEVMFEMHQDFIAEHAALIDLMQIRNLHASLLEFDFSRVECGLETRLAASCSTWDVQRVHIHRCYWRDVHIVRDLLGALMDTGSSLHELMDGTLVVENPGRPLAAI